MQTRLPVAIIFCFTMLLYELPRAESPPDKFFADKNYSHLFGANLTIRVETNLKAFHDVIERAKTNPSINKKLEQSGMFEGFSEFDLANKTCTIYWPYPEFEHLGQIDARIDINSEESRKKLIVLGHELIHCLLGNFHN